MYGYVFSMAKINEILMHNIGKLYQQIKPHKYFTSMEKTWNYLQHKCVYLMQDAPLNQHAASDLFDQFNYEN